MPALRAALIGMLAAWCLGSSAAAQNPSAFAAAVEDIAAHNRAALAHLREDRRDLAAVEIERMRESFALFAERYGGSGRPASHADNPDYPTVLVDVPTRLVTALMMLEFGRPDIAYNSLVATCRALAALGPPTGQSDAPCGEPVEPLRGTP